MTTASVKSQLSIRAKIFLVAVCFQLPMVVLAYFVVDAINYHNWFATLETKGNAYQTPLMGLLKDVGDHQRLVHHCPAGTDCPSAIAALNDDIAKNLQNLKVVNAKYGNDLEFTGEGLAKRKRQLATRENLEKSWMDLSEMVSKPGSTVSADADAKYEAVYNIVNMMITHAGDTSKLILDPDLDTYYTMDITLLALPQTMNRVRGMIAGYQAAVEDGKFSLDEQMKLAADAALLQTSDIDRIMGDTQTAMNENSNEFHSAVDSFQSGMASASADYSKAATPLAEMTKKLSLETTPTVTLDEYTAAAVAAQEQAYKFWTLSSTENSNLFQLRMNFFTHQRNISLMLSALALAAATFVAYMMARSMIVPLNRLSLKLAPGANLLSGTIKQIKDAASKGGDNSQMIGIICEELSAHADDMHETASNLEVLVFGREMNR